MKNIFEVLKAENYPEIRTVKVSRSETLFREEDLCVYLGIVKKGQVEIVSYSFEGKEIIFNVINPNEMFGNNLLFSSNPYYKGNVVATVDTELILINKKTLLNILQTNSEFLNLYLEHSSNNVIALNAKIKLLSLDNAKERFIYYLYVNGGNVSFKSVTNLAKELNLSREALSRLISKLKKDNVIKVTKKKEIILL